MRIAALTLAAALAAAGCSHSPMPNPEPSASQAAARKPLPAPEGSKLLSGTLETFNAACAADLERARAQIASLKALKPSSDGRAILEAYDEATAALGASLNRSSLTREVHPQAAFRDAARACEQKADALNVEISQDRSVYDALSAVDLSQADAATRYWMERTLLEFRRAGVDRDDATRAKVKALNEEILKLGQTFNQNIAEDVRKVELEPKELAGLPEDFIKAHAPGANGKVVLTSNYPDYFPFMTYARDGKAREKVWRAYHQRAHPKNLPVLEQLIAKRHELATLLGYPTWAAFVTETKMTRTQQVASEFIDKVAATAEQRAKQEHADLLARKQKDDPKATTLEPWDQDYYEDRLKAEKLGFDSQSLRAYFEYGRVKKGVMDITSRMWGITYVPVKDAAVWHPEVEAYDVTENGTLLGRIFLDMHPREDKYKHAAQFDLVAGQAGKRYPEGSLVCNFPRPGELMTQDEVETFFHEFGHLLHHVFAGRQQWKGITGISTEWDFVETPSMLLQQWASNPTILQEFARHHQSGEVIPAAQVAQLRASKEFGKGLWTRRQMFLAAVSLDYYSRTPGFNTTEALKTQQEKYSPFRHEYRDGTHFQLAFGHLEGYSAAYYTYVWSLVIAKDLETEFQKHGYLDTATTMKYRKTVLEPGGSKPAAELVKDFLGRPYGFEAYRSYLDAK
ncbi:Zn-dependent oligopeptidase [Archangium sp. miwbw1]|uniref:Zn-dependent oligopeptidase n=2 Tax=Archangium lansingense TaxID=2995310 RepID=A0ABT4ALC9_9BACT|nr:M3 family metallopeptidase [Archangium lansinium]MCY1082500.1 Zn-dependent oligopeptidase [Archangium lansinium]